MSDGSQPTSTWVVMRDDGRGWPFPSASHVIHRRDLSDLAEPYLSVVRNARAMREAMKR